MYYVGKVTHSDCWTEEHENLSKLVKFMEQLAYESDEKSFKIRKIAYDFETDEEKTICTWWYEWNRKYKTWERRK